MRSAMTSAVVRVVLLAIVVLFQFPLYSQGITTKYVEDFSTKQYCDTLNTTACWDTVAGELKLLLFDAEIVGTYDTPGNAWGIYVSGDYAFIADSQEGLRIMDISDPTNPVQLGYFNTIAYARDVYVDGDYAYVADDAGGLSVIDVTNPSAPIYRNRVPLSDARGVCVSGDYAYVTDRWSGLKVIDISDPTTPTLVATYTTPTVCYGVYVAGNYAYVGVESAGLYIIDITDPTIPTLAATYDTPSQALDVHVSGDYAYVADWSGGLLVFDISDPTNPMLAGSYDTPGNSLGIFVEGDYAYIADEIAGGLQIIDISDPTNPVLSDFCDTPGAARSVFISGEYAYVADGDPGLQVIKVFELAAPSRISLTALRPIPNGVQVVGDHAFIAQGSWMFPVLDISDPANPVQSETNLNNTGGYAIYVSGDYVFRTATDSTLQSVDIIDPMNPVLAGSCKINGNGFCVAVSGDYAFVACMEDGVKVVDISDPANPSLVGSCDTPGSALDLCIAGDYVYVADESGGLQVINITNPASPAIAGSYSTPGESEGIFVCGDYAFIADAEFLILDISDPENPSYISECDLPGKPMKVDVSGDYAFVVNGTLYIVDITDPHNPTIVDSYWPGSGAANNVDVCGEYAFLTVYMMEYLDIVRVFDKPFDPEMNEGRSIAVDGGDYSIRWASLTSSQTDTVSWELSADGGTSWQDIEPDGAMDELDVPGIDLMWRSTHILPETGLNPTVSNLTIEWLYDFALIESVLDIPNDQGRQVRIEWSRSGYDYLGSGAPITEYAVYRKIDYSLASMPSVPGATFIGLDLLAEKYVRLSALAYPPGDWDFVTTVPARCEETYAVVVPTLADSTIADGMYYTTFFVSAMTATPGVYYDSPPDSGYSVDNLSPQVPTGLMVAYNTGDGNELVWDECPDADFQYFCVYRSEDEEFEPSPENLAHMTVSASWSDPADEGWKYHYLVSAVDFSGNESDAASPSETTGDDTPATPEAFALHQNHPNPFNPNTTIRFDLPEAAHVGLRIYDVSGRLVRTLVDSDMAPGNKEATWDGRDGLGREVASGIYFYRLDAGGFTQTKKMVLLK